MPIPNSPLIVVDTNVIWADALPALNPEPTNIQQIQAGRLRMVWSDATRREIERIVGKIPPLSGMKIADLFREENRYDGQMHLEKFHYISDPDDRKFAALAEATGAVLITSDDHLLSVREQSSVVIQTPGEFWSR